MRDETRATAAWVLQHILKIIHPFAPFVSEELWQQTGGDGSIMQAGNWPKAGFRDDAAVAEFTWIADLISQIRSVRAETNVPGKAKLTAHFPDLSADRRDVLERNWNIISRMVGLDGHSYDIATGMGNAQIVVDGSSVVLPLADVIDLNAERDRVLKSIGKLDQDISKTEKKLGNEKFVAKAPDHVVATERERLEDAKAARAKLADGLTRLGLD